MLYTHNTLHGKHMRGRTNIKRPVHAIAGFSIVEVLIALTISSMLLTAVMVALDASFKAYQSTTESASRHTIARLTTHRVLAMIRTGSEFGPFPVNVITDPIIESDFIEFITVSGELIRLEYRELDEAIFVIQDPDGTPVETVLLTGVIPQYDGGNRIPVFTMQYAIGPKLYRATVDILVGADSDIDLSLEGDDVPPLRLVASTMPRNNM